MEQAGKKKCALKAWENLYTSSIEDTNAVEPEAIKSPRLTFC